MTPDRVEATCDLHDHDVAFKRLVRYRRGWLSPDTSHMFGETLHGMEMTSLAENNCRPRETE